MSQRSKCFSTMVLCSAVLTFSSQVTAQQSNGATPQGGEVKIQVNVNSVLVPVVVRDGQGRALGNLKKEDFQVFDKGKPQSISGFTVEKRAASEGEANVGGPARNVPNNAASSAPQRPEQAPDRFVVFLFDDLHMSTADLAGIKSSATKMLRASLLDSVQAAVISIFGRVDSGVTNDRARLEAAIAKIQARSPYGRTGRECPDVDYYHADRIENRQDSEALEEAILDVITCARLDPQMRVEAESMARAAARESMLQGDRDVRQTLSFLRELTRKMAVLPGERTIVFISPGFFTGNHEGMTLQSQVLDAAARSNVTISTLDPRGLYTTALNAGDEAEGSARETRLKSDSNVQSKNIIEEVMADIADGSGGTFFHNSNDFEGGLKRLSVAPEYVYLLEFSIDNAKPDGTYHPLRVKVEQRDVKVQARRGYFAPKAGKNK